MLLFWGLIFITGYYLCGFIFVQFSDEFIPALGTFSGVYEMMQTGIAKKPKYIEARRGLPEIVYCDTKRVWALSYGDTLKLPDNPCELPREISSETTSFDILDVAESPWFTTNGESGSLLVPFKDFQMSCYDCEVNGDFCGYGGSCKSNICECDREHYGLRCEFLQPCSLLEIDTQGGKLLGTRAWSNRYERISYNPLLASMYLGFLAIPVCIISYTPLNVPNAGINSSLNWTKMDPHK